MCPLDNPPPGSIAWIFLFGFLLFPYLANVRRIPLLSHEHLRLRSHIGFVRAQMRPFAAGFSFGPFYDYPFQGFLQ
jgi:hypothetical protein